MTLQAGPYGFPGYGASQVLEEPVIMALSGSKAPGMQPSKGATWVGLARSDPKATTKPVSWCPDREKLASSRPRLVSLWSLPDDPLDTIRLYIGRELPVWQKW